MSRTAAIARAYAYFDEGAFLADLSRRVAIPSSSQEPERTAALQAYLDDEMVASLTPIGSVSVTSAGIGIGAGETPATTTSA